MSQIVKNDSSNENDVMEKGSETDKNNTMNSHDAIYSIQAIEKNKVTESDEKVALCSEAEFSIKHKNIDDDDEFYDGSIQNKSGADSHMQNVNISNDLSCTNENSSCTNEQDDLPGKIPLLSLASQSTQPSPAPISHQSEQVTLEIAHNNPSSQANTSESLSTTSTPQHQTDHPVDSQRKVDEDTSQNPMSIS